MAANQECQDRGLFGKKDEGRQHDDMMQNQGTRPNPNPAQKSGMVDKVKEKLPGGHTQTAQCNPQTAQCNPAEKEGMMDKIKEKIPGGHTQNQCETADCKPGEKKGMGDKIKERLPGSRNKE